MAFKTARILIALALLATVSNAAEIIRHESSGKNNQYMVVFKEHVDIERALEHVAATEVKKILKSHDYMHVDMGSWKSPSFFEIPEADGTPMIGYTTTFTEEHLQELANDPDIEYIEQDQVITISPIESSDNSFDAESSSNESQDFRNVEHKILERQKATWGLARVSTRKWDQDSIDARLFKYDEEDGKNVTAYVVDTGVYVYHPEFEGRATLGKSFVEDQFGEPTDALDGHGHGTHCASTIAGKTYGVAPNANIVAVRVLDAGGSGSTSGVVGGVSWAVKEHVKSGIDAKSIISMSLGGFPSPTLDRAVNAAIDAGVHVAVAAGNESGDACRGSPSRAEKVTTVGATDVNDVMAYFSNWGKCVNIFAPGHLITGAWLDNTTNTISGTSMATPHIAGVMAAYLSRMETNPSPKKLQKILTRLSTKDALSGLPDSGNTVNEIAYTCDGRLPGVCDGLDEETYSFDDVIKNDYNVPTIQAPSMDDAETGESFVSDMFTVKGIMTRLGQHVMTPFWYLLE